MWARLFLVAAFTIFSIISPTFAQVVGDKVRLSGSNSQGVPVHPGPEDSSYFRWANGTEGTIKSIHAPNGWMEVQTSSGLTGWIVRRYLTVVAPEADDSPDIPENEALSYVIGAWNLEWFHETKTRGFPENTYTPRGPTYGPRNDEDFAMIARAITNNLMARLLVLTEINGMDSIRSAELDRLLVLLGASWRYEIGASGGAQRVAMLYDTSAMRREFVQEFVVPPEDAGGSDIFYRDPLVGRFTLLDRAGAPKNDFIVIGLHLASGQGETQNHNRAMEVLRVRLHQALQNGLLPADEKDVLIAGDLNASRYDAPKENFWESYDPVLKFRTLSPDDGEEYPGTRLAGVPLLPKSKIDYIFASSLDGGLTKDLVQWNAQVHTELLSMGLDEYRSHLSDHLPVTVRVKVVDDDD